LFLKYNRMANQKVRFVETGHIKEIQEHLAKDRALQRSVGFVPIDNVTEEQLPDSWSDEAIVEKKSVEPAAINNPEPVSGPDIVNPAELLAGKSQENDAVTLINKLHGEGKTVKEIAKETGLHWKTVESTIKNQQS